MPISAIIITPPSEAVNSDLKTILINKSRELMEKHPEFTANLSIPTANLQEDTNPAETSERMSKLSIAIGKVQQEIRSIERNRKQAEAQAFAQLKIDANRLVLESRVMQNTQTDTALESQIFDARMALILALRDDQSQIKNTFDTLSSLVAPLTVITEALTEQNIECTPSTMPAPPLITARANNGLENRKQYLLEQARHLIKKYPKSKTTKKALDIPIRNLEWSKDDVAIQKNITTLSNAIKDVEKGIRSKKLTLISNFMSQAAQPLASQESTHNAFTPEVQTKIAFLQTNLSSAIASANEKNINESIKAFLNFIANLKLSPSAEDNPECKGRKISR